MKLEEKLLRDHHDSSALPLDPALNSCWNARGLYNPLQFVLRLRPDIHNELDSIEPGIKSGMKSSAVQAFSTYFHETIHWWQHVGSTSGLMLSLIYPAQAHINNRILKDLVNEIGPVKPIINCDKSGSIANRPETARNVNRILNNWHDIEFFRWLSMDPKSAPRVVNSPYFECVGHSYEMAWASIIWLLSATLDREFEIFPDIRKWEKGFELLRKNKARGYFFGSDVVLPPIGVKAIFEGQARFSQLQYLYFASGETVTMAAFEEIGMLDGVYREAFDTFLEILGVAWPLTLNDPLVGLFLLLCDISINPTDGFPFDLHHFDSFIISVDPGTRFLMLCQLIRLKYPSLKDAIQKYTKEEYLEVSKLLCDGIVSRTPCDAAEKISTWASSHQGCQALLEEDDVFDFSPENLPVRVFFARYLRFQAAKFKVPEYFCWPGFWSAGDHTGGITLEQVEKLFDSHRALFVDKADGDVYASLFPGKKEEAILKTFDTFYVWNAIYELTRQWIIEEGGFDFNFLWLTTKYTQPEMTEWASTHFEKCYGVKPKSFKLI